MFSIQLPIDVESWAFEDHHVFFKFHQLSHGWLTLTIRIESDVHDGPKPECSLRASHPWDPTSDFVEFIRAVRAGDFPTVSFDAEGPDYAFSVLPCDVADHVILVVHEMESPFIYLAAPLGRHELADAFQRDLCAFVESTDDEEHWHTWGTDLIGSSESWRDSARAKLASLRYDPPAGFVPNVCRGRPASVSERVAALTPQRRVLRPT